MGNNYYFEAGEIGGGSYGYHFTPNYCPTEGTTDPVKRRVPCPWLSDKPPKTKDYLWCTKGWENDCHHVKVIEQPLKPFTEYCASPGAYEVLGNYWCDWIFFEAFELSEDRVVIRGSSGVTWFNRGYHVYHCFKHIVYPGSEDNPYWCRVEQYDQGFGWDVKDLEYSSPLAAHSAWWKESYFTTPSYVHGIMARPCYDPLFYRAKADTAKASYFGENEIENGSNTEYRMTAHCIKASAPFTFLEKIKDPCAAAYYDALSGIQAKACDNQIQNIAALLMIGCGISGAIKNALRAGKGQFGSCLAAETANAISDLCGFTTPGCQPMLSAAAGPRTTWYRRACYAMNKQQKAQASKSVRNAVKATCSAWLGYRYAYSTTVGDAYDALKYVDRQINKLAAGYDTTHASYGVKHFRNEFGEDVTIRCRINYKNKEIPDVLAAWQKHWELGMEPNLYVVWDMIPFSFMVDWFTDIGDWASVLSDLPHLLMFIDMTNVCYSCEYDHTVDDVKYNVYTRWHYLHMYPVEDIVAGMQLKDGSSATAFRRVNDYVALTIGGI